MNLEQNTPAFQRDLAFIYRTAPNGVNTVSISQYQKYHITLCLSLQISAGTKRRAQGTGYRSLFYIYRKYPKHS